jgi:DNA-binding NtrC family response regulator
MTLTDMRILIVADNAEVTALLAKELVCNLEADVTVADTLEEARALAASDGFDVIIAQEQLPDGDALTLLGEEGPSFDAAVVLVGDDSDAQTVLSALRKGACDIVPQPIDERHLLATVRKAAEARRRRRHAAARSNRLRRISSKLVRDRRELRQRVDLICRDLVSAYRRLAKKVVGVQNATFADEQKRDTCDPQARRPGA